MHETDSTWTLVVFSGVNNIIHLGSPKHSSLFSHIDQNIIYHLKLGRICDCICISKLFLQSEINVVCSGYSACVKCHLFQCSDLPLSYCWNSCWKDLMGTTLYAVTWIHCLPLKAQIITKIPLSLTESNKWRTKQCLLCCSAFHRAIF